MCKWCVRYQKIERLAKMIEDVYGPQRCGFEEEKGEGKIGPELQVRS